MSFVLGLTGSIGMGKSTTAGFFREAGVPVWDADAAVHRAYGPRGAALPGIAALRPAAVGPEGVDRAALKDWIAADPTALAQIEAVVHPLVSADRLAFLDRHRVADLVLLDVPLLYETGVDRLCDAVLVVTAPPEVQRARVLARPGMSEDALAVLLAKQMPDAEKRARADHIIETTDLAPARAAVQALIERIRHA